MFAAIDKAINTKLSHALAPSRAPSHARAMHAASSVRVAALAPVGGAAMRARHAAREPVRASANGARFAQEISRRYSVVAEAAEEGAEARGAEEHRIYVGNLSWGVNDDSLRSFFGEFDVKSASVMKDRETGRSRGFGFVLMNSADDVQAAVSKLNERELDGRTVRVSQAQPQGERPARGERGERGERPLRMPRAPRARDGAADGRRVYFGNLSWGMDQYDLQDLCGEFGSVEDSRLVTDKETGRSRGFGFVTMSSQAEAEEVVAQLNGQDVDGRVLRVNIALAN